MVVAGQACDASTDDSGHFVRFYQADAWLIDALPVSASPLAERGELEAED